MDFFRTKYPNFTSISFVLHCKLLFKAVNKTLLEYVFKKILFYSIFFKNPMCYLPYLCNYLCNLIAVSERKLFVFTFFQDIFQSQFELKYFSTNSFKTK